MIHMSKLLFSSFSKFPSYSVLSCHSFSTKTLRSFTEMSKVAIPKPHIRYIEPRELREFITNQQDQDSSDFAIIDVRDSDFVGGNIVGAINIPSKTFHGYKAGLAERLSSKSYVIFHCALSQVRGPKCARIYHQLLTEAISADADNEGTQETLILRGGFTAWQSLYKHDPNLVERFDQDIWDNVE